ncbi:hypothetical protein J8E27_15085 [Brucella sp. 458]|uniref:hypothetical protein n=1 Tax=unclassified Brucella TaxID=2632610 RepID=UPI00046CAF93|nr:MULTISPECIES: hypothetical protein [unclassified Brucella]QPN28449.1 NAD-dependent dehydratase [Brucella sp. BO2]QTO00015.1 hypothetical protein J8E27_15085 [Brucella sp. 458]
MDYIRTGKVEWTGDNPPIYLKTDPDGDWTTLALFFRINGSDHGRGNMMLVIEDPYDNGNPDPVRLCVTDNPSLARYLINEFVRKFSLFRSAQAALNSLEITDGAKFSVEADYPRYVTEIANFGMHRLEMSWMDLTEMFAVAQPAKDSQTGAHEMFSVFQPATTASIILNGRKLPGNTIERDFFERRAQSASLAHSESWIQT